MDPRIKTVATTSADLLVDYASGVIEASAKLVDTLLENVATLTGTVIHDATEVVLSACEVFLPGDDARES